MYGRFEIQTQNQLRGLYDQDVTNENNAMEIKLNEKVFTQDSDNFNERLNSHEKDHISKKLASENKEIRQKRDYSQVINNEDYQIKTKCLKPNKENNFLNSSLQNDSQRSICSQGNKEGKKYFSSSQVSQNVKKKNMKTKRKGKNSSSNSQIPGSSQNTVKQEILEYFNEVPIIEEEELDVSFPSQNKVLQYIPSFHSQKIISQKIKLVCKSNFQVNFFKVEQIGLEMNITTNKIIYMIVTVDYAEKMIIGKNYDVCFNKDELIDKEDRDYVYFFTDNIKECK